jgi:hypothetical protein
MPNRPTQPRSRRRGVTVQRPGGRSGPVIRSSDGRFEVGLARPYDGRCSDGSPMSPVQRRIAELFYDVGEDDQ